MEWQPISTCPNQTTVLVCNDCFLGWHVVAIQNALGEWHEDGTKYRACLKYEPTHWMELPSIYPISIRQPKAHAN